MFCYLKQKICFFQWYEIKQILLFDLNKHFSKCNVLLQHSILSIFRSFWESLTRCNSFFLVACHVTPVSWLSSKVPCLRTFESIDCVVDAEHWLLMFLITIMRFLSSNKSTVHIFQPNVNQNLIPGDRFIVRYIYIYITTTCRNENRKNLSDMIFLLYTMNT